MNIPKHKSLFIFKGIDIKTLDLKTILCDAHVMFKKIVVIYKGYFVSWPKCIKERKSVTLLGIYRRDRQKYQSHTG